MRIIIIFCCFLFSFCSGNQLENEISKYENEELIALNDVIINLWGKETGSVPKVLPPLPLSERKNKKDSLLYYEEEQFVELKFKELKAGIIDTAFFCPRQVIIRDTLFDLSKLSENIDKNIFNSELLHHIINTPRKFDVENITDRNGYLFVSKQSIPIQYRTKYTGLTFTRIIFNKGYSLGYFITDSYDGGSSFLIEKTKGKWIIKKKEQMWVY